MNDDFNFGEHIHYNSSDILSGLFISFVGAFLGFLFALWINRHIENKRRNEDELKREETYKDRLRYLMLYIDSVTQTAQIQQEKYLDFAKHVQKTPFKILIPKIVATSDFERLKNYSSNDLLEAYLYFDTNKETNLNSYKEIFVVADFFDKSFGEYPKAYGRYVEEVYEQEKFVKMKTESITIDIDNRLKSIEKQHPDKYAEIDEYKFLNKFALKYGQITEGEIDIKRIKTEVLNPLSFTIRDSYLDTNFANSIFKEIRMTLNKIDNIESNSLRYASIIESVSTIHYINICIENLNKSKDLIRKMIDGQEGNK